MHTAVCLICSALMYASDAVNGNRTCPSCSAPPTRKTARKPRRWFSAR